MKARPSWRNLAACALGLIAASFATAAIFDGSTTCEKPWVFFDLGNTVITSGAGTDSRYLPGAHEYVRELRKRGYPIGLITNVPEKWGRSRAEKIRQLKKLVGETWTKQAGADAMDWSDFPDAAILLPPTDAQRKPSPYLFHSARAKVSLEEGTRDCPIVYQGEDPLEVGAAEKTGMIGYVVGKDPAAPFLPIERLERR